MEPLSGEETPLRYVITEPTADVSPFKRFNDSMDRLIEALGIPASLLQHRPQPEPQVRVKQAAQPYIKSVEETPKPPKPMPRLMV